jgi:3D (Asp-Asp-Asp) domain-containing protein
MAFTIREERLLMTLVGVTCLLAAARWELAFEPAETPPISGAWVVEEPAPPTTVRPPQAEAVVIAEPAPAPARHWLPVLALVTAYTDHDPDAPLGPDGEPLRKTAWQQRDTAVRFPYGVAADPLLLPYGSRVVVPEYLGSTFPDRAWEIDDTGGRIRQNRRYRIVHLDLRYRTTWSAAKQGKEWREIFVDVTGWDDAAVRRLAAADASGRRMRDQGRMP